MNKTGYFCPVFNVDSLEERLEQDVLEKDEQGLFRPLETILFPEETLIIHNVKGSVVSATIPAYQPTQSYFLLNACLVPSEVIVNNKPDLSTESILKRLQGYIGAPYVWGGNWILDNDSLECFEKIFVNQTKNFIKNMKFLFSGVDCSGLLYAATYGKTPRNTSQLVHFGTPLDIVHLDVQSILNRVRPLDLIVWKGHVLIFLTPSLLIESRNPEGVLVVDAVQRMHEICKTRAPSDQASAHTFVIRRPTESFS